MTILEEVPAELAAVANALHATPVLAGFTIARGRMRVEVSLAAPGRLKIRVERPDLLVAPPKSPKRERAEAPYRTTEQAPPVPVIDPLSPVELVLEAGETDSPDRLRVETKLDEAAASHVLTPEVRRRAAALLTEGFAAVWLLREGPAVEAERDIEEGLPADGEMIRAGIDGVAEIVSSLPTIATPTAWRRATPANLAALWWAVPPLLLVSMLVQLGMFSFLNPIGNFAGLLIGAGIALTLGPIAAVLQMRRGRSGSVAAQTFLWIGLAVPLGLQSGLLLVNCTLDSSPVTPWHAKVARLETRRHDETVDYDAVLERRSPKHQPVRIGIEEEMYRELQARREDRRVVVLDLRRGLLDLTWYTRVQLQP